MPTTRREQPGALLVAEDKISVYHGLCARLRRLPVDDDLDEFRTRAARLLACHQRMLHQAVDPGPVRP
ncbi:hypothetical protein [Streptomyces sp. NPDC047028]|uniref:hypothetical protein n=1 Tax=Streptomyces sp. NPDC047028 TaxID=3155793 RepID=UPI0033FB5AF8